MRVVRTVLIILGITILLFVSFVTYITTTDLKPEEMEILSIKNNQMKEVPLGEEIVVTTYNIGYGGLDKSQDFFADGGERSRAESLDSVRENLDAVIETLDGTESDILVLQEVDQNSSRSFGINQVGTLEESYPNFGHIYGLNYRVPWVPVPVANPMGKVTSGIMTLTRYNAEGAARYQLPGEEDWPVYLFELDRCITETRLKTVNDKELVVVNLHLSAFDKGGIIRLKQLEYLKNYLEAEYEKGNYIIAGGDWNHNLPGSDPMRFHADEDWPFWLKDMPEDYTVEGFVWAVDPSSPTVRTLERPYVDGYNFKAVIDGFLLSDNIEVIATEGIDTNFENTDHNPVKVTVRLK